MTQINFWSKIIYKHSLVQEGLNYLLLITAPRLVLLGLLLTRKASPIHNCKFLTGFSVFFAELANVF